jgi:hypothetical protein
MAGRCKLDSQTLALLRKGHSSKSPNLPLLKGLPPRKGIPPSQRVPNVYPDLEGLNRAPLSTAVLPLYLGETHPKTQGQTRPGTRLFPLHVLPGGIFGCEHVHVPFRLSEVKKLNKI